MYMNRKYQLQVHFSSTAEYFKQSWSWSIADLWPLTLTGWVLVPPLQLNCFCMYVAAGWGSDSAYCEASGWDLGCKRRWMDAAVLNESDSEGWGRRSCCCSTCTLPLRAEPRLPRAWCGSLPLCAQKESDGNGGGPGLFLMRRAGTGTSALDCIAWPCRLIGLTTNPLP